MTRRLLLLLPFVLSACASWHLQSVTPDSVFAQRPKTVRLAFNDNRKLIVDRPILQNDTIIGRTRVYSEYSETRIPLNQVQGIETMQNDRRGTLFLAGALALVFGLAIKVIVDNN